MGLSHPVEIPVGGSWGRILGYIKQQCDITKSFAF